jgi:type IV fimbrial biogenesis protein FimT
MLIVNSKEQKGFTLVELMITLAMAAILLGIGVPAMQDMSSNARMRTEANNMVSMLQFARSEAVKYQYEVVICPSADGATCANGANPDFLIVFVDDNDNDIVEATDGNGQPDLGEALLRSGEMLGPGQEWDTPAPIAGIAFLADGLVKNNAVINLKLIDNSNSDKIKIKCVQVEVSGRPSVVDAVSSNCPGF